MTPSEIYAELIRTAFPEPFELHADGVKVVKFGSINEKIYIEVEHDGNSVSVSRKTREYYDGGEDLIGQDIEHLKGVCAELNKLGV